MGAYQIIIISSCLHHSTENRLKKIKGQSGDVTSKEMLRSLSQAKKECWDRFLHDAQTSELFQGGDLDERWDVDLIQPSCDAFKVVLRPNLQHLTSFRE